jgi:hypothetical protein
MLFHYPASPVLDDLMIRFKIRLLGVCFALLAVAAFWATRPSRGTVSAAEAPNGGAFTAFGYYLTPYAGTVDHTQGQLNSVDFFHNVIVTDKWAAALAELGIGKPATALNGSDANTFSNPSVAQLDAGMLTSPVSFTEGNSQAATWLADQYPIDASVDPIRSSAIQTAVWSIASAVGTAADFQQLAFDSGVWKRGTSSMGVDGGSIVADAGALNYWTSHSDAQFDKQSAGDYDKYVAFNDSPADGRNPPHGGSGDGVRDESQAPVYATPEPGTFVLMGSGLLAMIGFVGVRRKKASTADVRLPTDAVA